MNILKFKEEETHRLEYLLAIIKSSLNMNPDIIDKTRNETIALVTRLFDGEMEYLEENPKDYYDIYVSGNNGS